MSFDVPALRRLVAHHGPVARVLVADVAGSAPREVGAAMAVWGSGEDGTIGGGALEHQSVARARAALAGKTPRFDRVPLGPALGQCCGGAVGLLTELWDEAALAGLEGSVLAGSVLARPLPGGADAMPLSVQRLIARARREGIAPTTRIVQGWLVEPLAGGARDIWIWGAGHVGRALAEVLAPLPGLRLTWVDVAEDRFPAENSRTGGTGPVRRIAANPPDLVAEAPAGAEHLVLTFSHALDLELCHRLLRHGFGGLGLIGSATKWARFRSRLLALGHRPDMVDRIVCPIGDPALGKHPQAIAIGVAAGLLGRRTLAADGRGRMRPQGEGTG